MNPKDVKYEKVDSLFANNHTVKVGYKYRCRCDHEVHWLYPIWDSKTGKHLCNDPGNTFSTRLIPSALCPVHAQYAKK
jgi:hypothetical protein